eukprot:5021892-Amphidinium_carterae.1
MDAAALVTSCHNSASCGSAYETTLQMLMLTSWMRCSWQARCLLHGRVLNFGSALNYPELRAIDEALSLSLDG